MTPFFWDPPLLGPDPRHGEIKGTLYSREYSKGLGEKKLVYGPQC